MTSKLSIVLSLFLVFTSNAAIRYVSQAGSGTMNGTSWANAFPGNQLQVAINQSNAGDEVWVAAGTYYPTSTADRTVSFSMKNGVTIRGNFNGTEQTENQRLWRRTPITILSGDIGTRNNFADNSYHVIHNVNINSTAVLESVVITQANESRAASNDEGLGGGIYNDGTYSKDCSPTFRHCLITENHAFFGGGMFNSGAYGGRSNPLLEACVFINNTAVGGGGAIDNFGLGGEASPHLINCVIVRNTAETGGGVYCWGGNSNGKANPLFEHCLIAYNSATNGNAGGIIADNSDSGGSNSSGTSTPILVNSILQYNTASLIGPQFYCKGTATVEATYCMIDTVEQRGAHVITGEVELYFDLTLFENPTDPEGFDNQWFTSDDGFSIRRSFISDDFPVDKGKDISTISTDIMGLSRIFGGAPDIGPYELIYGAIDEKFTTSFHAYPNPAVTELSIQSENSTILKVLDLQGKVMEEIPVLAGITTLSLGEISAGTYLLRDASTGAYQQIIIGK